MLPVIDSFLKMKLITMIDGIEYEVFRKVISVLDVGRPLQIVILLCFYCPALSIVNFKNKIDDMAREATRRITMLPYDIRWDGIVTIKDTITKTVEERLFLVDSITFKKLVKERI